MKSSKKANLLVLGLTLLTSVALIGSTMGTLSWYAYSTHSSLSYTGTSVKKSVLLSVGIVDDDNHISQHTIETQHLEIGSEDGHRIIWTASSNGLSEDVITEYLKGTDFASTVLAPVTTNEVEVDSDGNVILYQAPEYGDLEIETVAETTDYVRIPFAFKIVDNDGNRVNDQDIWLTDTSVQVSGSNLNQAVRIYNNNINHQDSSFLLKPLKPDQVSYQKGETKLGGLLDLNGDKIYDYDPTSGEEFLYGRYDGTASYNAPSGKTWDEEDFDNVNGTPYLEASTFYAKHSGMAKRYISDSVTFATQEYETYYTTKPKMNSEGSFITDEDGNGKPITTTDSDDYVGYATFTIFLEGWDHAIVNNAAGYSFNLGLSFEINKI